MNQGCETCGGKPQIWNECEGCGFVASSKKGAMPYRASEPTAVQPQKPRKAHQPSPLVTKAKKFNKRHTTKTGHKKPLSVVDPRQAAYEKVVAARIEAKRLFDKGITSQVGKTPRRSPKQRQARRNLSMSTNVEMRATEWKSGQKREPTTLELINEFEERKKAEIDQLRKKLKKEWKEQQISKK